MGVDIIQNCEVKGIKRNGDSVEGLETTKGFIKTNKIGVVAAGHSSVIANMAGLKLPLESKPLQALVSEPVKPIIDTVVMSNAVHAYVSQSDKGELVIGAGTDDYISYSQKGSHDIVEGTLNAILELYPIFSRMRMLRQWGGIVDICPDASPIISKTSIKGLYFNCGWGTGGFKATPGSGDLFAHTIANDEPHELNAAFNINRFVSGDLVDEHGAAAVAH
jgi:sarcosine oxidase subunit beta